MAEIEPLRGHQAPLLIDAPSGDLWNETQWRVFFALLDAVVLPVVVQSHLTDRNNQKKISADEFDQVFNDAQASMTEAPTREDFAAYLAERTSSNPAFAAAVRRTVADVPPSLKKQL